MSSIEELKHLLIPLHEISRATDDFDPENSIGTHAHGKVYRGESEKHGAIVIKRWDRSHLGESGHGDHEFETEIRLLPIYKHENVVSLHGFCDENGEKILVYKYYESKASLDKNLKSKYLGWTQRLHICLDAARGLMHLHNGVGLEDSVVHGDVKSGNIILWYGKARISNIGLSRNGPGPSGTLQYIDPEYFSTGHLTQKSDVFSFGVVLFEVLSGRPAFRTVDGQFFSVWVKQHYINKRLDKIIHPGLREQINPASVLKFSDVAYRCLKTANERPTMAEVVEQLQKALDIQLTPSGASFDIYNVSTAAEYDESLFSEATSFLSAHTSSPNLYTTSSSESSLSGGIYDVFLSFRGQDTRMTFIKRLHSALVEQRVYKDELIPRGESIGPALFKAIQESKIAIIIFSENFADSDWCLNELEYIMKCRAERGLVVIPVFYCVDPSDVRRQKRKYGAAFSKHELENIDKVESWRKALVDAANIAGFVVTGDEEKVIEEIVYTITHTYLSLIPSDNAIAERSAHTNLIGIESRKQDLRSLLENGSGSVRMVGICGIWGGGKSALASSIYDEIFEEFEGFCFLQNVRAESTMHGLKTLQEKILSDVFKSKVVLTNTKQGVYMMKRRLSQNKVLIVLDDVHHVAHLNMLAGSSNWFGDGSLIIITSRNQDLVNAHNCRTHNVRMLDAEEAIELFSWNAFGASRPEEGYEELSQSIVSKFGGHPATLQNLGSFLHGKDILDWTSALARLQRIRANTILEKVNPGDDGVGRNTFSWLLTTGGESKSVTTKMLKAGFRFLKMSSGYTKTWFGKFTECTVS